MNANLLDSDSYRCVVNSRGSLVSATLTGLCIRLTREKRFDFAADIPLIQVLGPVGGPDFPVDPSIPF